MNFDAEWIRQSIMWTRCDFAFKGQPVGASVEAYEWLRDYTHRYLGEHEPELHVPDLHRYVDPPDLAAFVAHAAHSFHVKAYAEYLQQHPQKDKLRFDFPWEFVQYEWEAEPDPAQAFVVAVDLIKEGKYPPADLWSGGWNNQPEVL